jgi:RNA polymerase sigma-70 factor (ECF subfamily)
LQINKRLVPIEELNEQPKETENFEYIELHNAVDFLEEELKIVVTLYYFEDFPLKEVAAILNTAEGTIKSRLHRARTKLADLLKIEYEGSACCE